jgi:CHAD domain-containing protein
MNKPWNDQSGIRENLQARLPKIVAAFFRRGRKAMKPSRAWDDMHEFRLSTKEFRYTLELFRPFYGATLNTRLESLRKIQQLLGDVSDAVATRKLIKGMAEAAPLREKLAKRAETKLKTLRTYWRQEFDAEGELEGWKGDLQHSAALPNEFSNKGMQAGF